MILMIGVYGPATLLGPLPVAAVTLTAPDAAVPASTPVLPAAGTSGLLAVTEVEGT